MNGIETEVPPKCLEGFTDTVHRWDEPDCPDKVDTTYLCRGACAYQMRGVYSFELEDGKPLILPEDTIAIPEGNLIEFVQTIPRSPNEALSSYRNLMGLLGLSDYFGFHDDHPFQQFASSLSSEGSIHIHISLGKALLRAKLLQDHLNRLLVAVHASGAGSKFFEQAYRSCSKFDFLDSSCSFVKVAGQNNAKNYPHLEVRRHMPWDLEDEVFWLDGVLHSWEQDEQKTTMMLMNATKLLGKLIDEDVLNSESYRCSIRIRGMDRQGPIFEEYRNRLRLKREYFWLQVVPDTSLLRRVFSTPERRQKALLDIFKKKGTRIQDLDRDPEVIKLLSDVCS